MSANTIESRKSAVVALAPLRAIANLLVFGLTLFAVAFIALGLSSLLSAILVFVANFCADLGQSLLAAYAGV